MRSSNNLKIDKPCPFTPTQWNKDGDGYFCKSCSKKITDFREKTGEEIKHSIEEDTCGIFTMDQLPGQQKMSWTRQSFFYVLTFFSFIGFSVKPLSAQTSQTKKDTTFVDVKKTSTGTVQTDTTAVKATNNKREHKLFRRKKKYRTIGGCPSF